MKNLTTSFTKAFIILLFSYYNLQAQPDWTWNATDLRRELNGGDAMIKGINGFSSGNDEARLFLGSTDYYIKGVRGPNGGVRIGTWSSPDALNITESTGRVGIGTTAPDYKLQVDRGEMIVRGHGNFSSYYDFATLYLGDGNHYIRGVRGVGVKIGTYQVGDVINIMQNGGVVGIGTSNIPDLNYKLYVKGGIRAEKIKVDVATTNGWADYVFEEDYQLMSLPEVEKFIQANKRLPEIPSAEEVVCDGVELTEMQVKLLKKIEELTLYSIEQNKRIEMLEKKLSTDHR